MRKIPKTFTISKESIATLNQAAFDEDRSASKIVDTLISTKITKIGHCEFCNSALTEDEVWSYKSMCYKCCSKAWKAYEVAHGGECRTDISKRHVTRAIKQDIIKRDGCACLKCGAQSNLTVDHITPLALGGSNDSDNLQTLCSTCNSAKSDTTADYREVIL